VRGAAYEAFAARGLVEFRRAGPVARARACGVPVATEQSPAIRRRPVCRRLPGRVSQQHRL